MKIFIVVLAEILLALLFLLFASNYGDGIVTLSCNGAEHTISYQLFAAIVYLIGGISTILVYTVIDISETRKLAAYKKDREKTSVANEEKDSKISALENQVKTLEAALDSVIKKEEN
jgi:Na+/melibiose symporter-like transporter